MKKTIIYIVLVLILASAIPASAYGHKTVGERIGIFFDGEHTFEAGAPFHIMHGWSLDPKNETPIGIHDFELEVDGVLYKPDYLLVTVNHGDDSNSMNRLWVFNFPEGMTDTHTFNGYWYAPCQEVNPIDECPKRNARVLTRMTTVVITFE
ncbi:MAG TPA: hypothetical protein VLA49_01315 [Anaerolineales bacterium]|nr:hypothetical protein [Anaerolineales bacterium]